MTRRLFHEDPYLKEFDSVVLQEVPREGGYAVILDQTAFYATSGGQPFDTGSLGSARVVDVIEDEATQQIVHILDVALPPGAIHGCVDWERRFDHMQQHTGQHILSQAFVRLKNAPTLSFHMGIRTSTIDVALSDPSDAAMQEAEELATRVVFDDRPVNLIKAQTEDLSALGVRKHSERQGEIRVIDVEGFDRSPCGGTHVRRTGEIGLISILGCERYKGGTRVEFVCGGRALATLRKDHETLKEIGKLYSAELYDLPRLAEKHIQERSALVRERSKLEEALIEFEARDMYAQTSPRGTIRIVRKIYAARSLDSVKLLAQKIVAQGSAVALLAATNDSAQVIVARSGDVAGDCGSVVKKACGEHQGRGGGKPDLAQAGGIPPGSLDAWLTLAESLFI